MSAAPPPPKKRLYRELLTPLLHRRFTSAASLVLCACYVETILIRSWSSKFWWLFPVGFAGIQTLLFFVPGFAIFILRVSQAHFGLRTSQSTAYTLKNILLSARTWWTLLTYIFFGLLYGEIYLWTAPGSADLAWVKEGKQYERMQLNERPIFLRSNFFMLSFMQAAYHLWWDISRIKLPRFEPVGQKGSESGLSMVPPSQKIKGALLSLLAGASARASIATFCNLFIYALFLRQTAWIYSRDIGRIVWNISRNAEPSFVPPYHWTLLVRSFTSGTLMIFLWDFSNFAFSTYVAQEPIKKGAPLTEDSPDPNGSLLNGLKSKKELPLTFAFWELRTISRNFDARREFIFADIDREGGSAWTQVLHASLTVIDALETRISNKAAPPPEMTLEKQRTTPAKLPKIAAPLEQGLILSPAPKATDRRASMEARAGALAKSLGSSPNGAPSLRNGLVTVRDSLLTPSQQAELSPAHVSASALEGMRSALRTPFGAPFRQKFADRACEKVLGTPYSDLDMVLCAIGAVSVLAGASVREDVYGTVHKDVATILRALARATGSVDAFLRKSPVHWTDVAFSEPDRNVPELDTVLTHLRCALRHVIASFEQYAKDMGLGAVELREARKAAGLEA